jgi:NADH-quinone oxidoreductase subunit H
VNMAVDISIRVVVAAALLLANSFVVSAMTRAILARSGAGGGGAGLPGSSSRPGDAPSPAARGTLLAASVIAFVPSVAACVPLALSRTVRLEPFETGAFFILALCAMAPVGAALAGWATQSRFSALAVSRAAVGQVAFGAALLLSAMTPVILAGSLDLSAIVDAQRGTWLYGFLPRWAALSPQIVSFAIYAVCAWALSGRVTVEVPSETGETIVGAELAEHARMFVLSALGVTLFLGGWLVPYVDRNPVAELLGPAVFLLKTYLVVLALVAVRARIAPLRADRLLALGWKILTPVSLAWLAVFSVFARVVKL